jgi:hypothetical protein
MSVNSPSFYGGCIASALDRTIQSGPFGNGIKFEQKPTKNGGQIITFSFSRMVYNYSFLITDIDTGLDDNGIFGLLAQAHSQYVHSTDKSVYR